MKIISSLTTLALTFAVTVQAMAAPLDSQKVPMGLSLHQAQLDNGSTDPVERYTYLEVINYSSSNPPVRRPLMDAPVPNVNHGDIIQLEGALQVTNNLAYTVELACKAIYTPSRGSINVLSTYSGVIFKEHGYNVSPQETRITSGNDEYRPVWANSATNKVLESESLIINNRFSGSHHGIFPFAASIKIDHPTMSNQLLYVDLVCYAGGGSETVTGDRLDVDFNGHMSVTHHYVIP